MRPTAWSGSRELFRMLTAATDASPGEPMPRLLVCCSLETNQPTSDGWLSTMHVPLLSKPSTREPAHQQTFLPCFATYLSTLKCPGATIKEF